MLLNRKLVNSPEEGEYHVVDWRSFRTPRMARSSLAAEAQAGGQAADAVDFTCRYWEHPMNPKITLKDLLQMPSSLKPILVTDARALYDSYHREGINSSVIDIRVSLESVSRDKTMLRLKRVVVGLDVAAVPSRASGSL